MDCYYDDYYGDCNFEDAKELLVDDYVRELRDAEEQTVTLTHKEWEDLSYACAHAEMMWRKRSHDPEIDSRGSYADTPEEFEVECRAEMKKYRVLQRKVQEAIGY